MSSPSLEQLTAPVTDLMDGAGEALEQWRWLVPETAEPVLLTTLGDLFLRTPDGAIYFLSTANGTFDRVAPSYAAWKQELRSQRRVSEWFCPAFVAELVRSTRRPFQRFLAGQLRPPITRLLPGSRISTF
jgi:hypothetical protein